MNSRRVEEEPVSAVAAHGQEHFDVEGDGVAGPADEALGHRVGNSHACWFGSRVFDACRAKCMLLAALLLAAVTAPVLLSENACPPDVFPAVIDDVYIHLAVAKTLVNHGVWGISPDEFVSGSSSPLWTVLLAIGFLTFGEWSWLAFVLNILFALALVFGADVMVGRELRCRGRLVCALALLTVGGIAPLTLVAMEHVGHAATAIGATFFGARALTKEERAGDSSWSQLFVFLACGFRYESLSIVAVLALAALVKRRVSFAAGLVAAGLLPMAALGLWMQSHGGFFVPNSILQKASTPAASSLEAIVDFAAGVLDRTIMQAHLVAAALASVMVQWRLVPRERRWDAAGIGWLVIVLAMVAQITFGRTLLLRYDVYVMALYVFWFVWRWPWTLRRDAFTVVLAALVIVTLTVRSGRTVKAAANRMPYTCEEPYAVALLFDDQFPDELVIINDLGYFAYFARTPLLDLAGLGSNEPVRFRQEGRDVRASYSHWYSARGARIAVVYMDHAFTQERMPLDWIHVASWTTERDAERGRAFFDFLARDEQAAELLRDGLKNWKRKDEFPTATIRFIAPEGARAP